MWKSSALLVLLIFCLPTVAVQRVTLSPEQAERIGQRIYQNETAGNPNNLIAWNRGEHFASLGIGHFIWFPTDLDSPFTESFPKLVDYLQQQGVVLPAWLTPQTDCPWPTQQVFQQARDSEQMRQLRQLLLSTFELQLAFILQRLNKAMPMLLASVDDEQDRSRIERQFQQLSQFPGGVYALIDYVNFKGEGTSLKERYQGQGWGLLQVLESMPEYPRAGLTEVDEFARAADFVLTRRVENSPQAEIEKRWLAGWRNRLQTYSDFK